MKTLSWPKLWLLFHLGIPVLLFFSLFFAAPPHINTSFLEMLPQPTRSGAAEADRLLGEKSGLEAIILASAPDFENAKKGAVLLYGEFEKSLRYDNSRLDNSRLENPRLIENLTLYFDPPAIAQVSEYFHDYRFVVAGKRTYDLLETGRAEEIALDALASAYGAFGFTSLDNIDKDPFLLAGRRMEDFLSSSLLAGGRLSLKDDVLAGNVGDNWNVLLRMTLTPEGASLGSGKNAVREIYAAAANVKEAIPGLEFYFSGIPFHSYESSSGAQREISLISTVTLIAILLLFLYVFRSVLPVFLSMTAALVSIALGTGTALLIFREIHVITFVFGTTLIGTCVDYSIHFFVHWKGNTALKSGKEIRSHISKSIIMSFISTEICFFVFLFAPFTILKQFAVFSMAGLLSSFLTSYCLYPLLKVPNAKRHISLPALKPPGHRVRATLAAAIAVFCLALLFFNSEFIKIQNDITSLYTMSPSLLESEKRMAQVLDRGSSVWYFIVSGGSPEETLENEERLTRRLDEEILRGNLQAYLATSLFVPSVKSQKKTYEAMKALLPLVPSQYENLGFPPEYAAFFYDEFTAGERYCLPENAPVSMGVSNLWIGKVGDNYYSCVMPLYPGDEAIFRSIAELKTEELGGFVFFINKAKDISSDLDTITKTMAFFFLAACIIVSILVFIVYPLRDGLKICIMPFAVVLSALAVLALNKITAGFFSAVGIILVFGLGLDYIFYMTGGKQKGHGALTSLAVLLSFLTTMLSFGALALSSFVPVHIFGLTVSAGLGGAFITAMLLADRKGGGNSRDGDGNSGEDGVGNKVSG